MKSTSRGSRLVSSAARSPERSRTGPAVWRRLTSISFATTWARVVLPRPGGPKMRRWSRASPRRRAASMKISICSSHRRLAHVVREPPGANGAVESLILDSRLPGHEALCLHRVLPAGVAVFRGTVPRGGPAGRPDSTIHARARTRPSNGGGSPPFPARTLAAASLLQSYRSDCRVTRSRAALRVPPCKGPESADSDEPVSRATRGRFRQADPARLPW